MCVTPELGRKLSLKQVTLEKSEKLRVLYNKATSVVASQDAALELQVCPLLARAGLLIQPNKRPGVLMSLLSRGAA